MAAPTSSRSVSGPRRRRIWRLVLILGLIDFYLWYRYLTDNPFRLPTLGPEAVIFLPIFLLFGAVALMMPLFSGGPHTRSCGQRRSRSGSTRCRVSTTRWTRSAGPSTCSSAARPSAISWAASPRRGSVRRTAGHREDVPRQGDGQAGRDVPFLFTAAPAFQSMWFGMTNSKIRSFFRRLRKLARKEGAIGFIERSARSAADAAG